MNTEAVHSLHFIDFHKWIRQVCGLQLSPLMWNWTTTTNWTWVQRELSIWIADFFPWKAKLKPGQVKLPTAKLKCSVRTLELSYMQLAPGSPSLPSPRYVAGTTYWTFLPSPNQLKRKIIFKVYIVLPWCGLIYSLPSSLPLFPFLPCLCFSPPLFSPFPSLSPSLLNSHKWTSQSCQWQRCPSNVANVIFYQLILLPFLFQYQAGADQLSISGF